MEEDIQSSLNNKNCGLGCGKEFLMKTSSGYICGVANALGTERLCGLCDAKIRLK